MSLAPHGSAGLVASASAKLRIVAPWGRARAQRRWESPEAAGRAAHVAAAQRVGPVPDDRDRPGVARAVCGGVARER